MIVLFHRMTGHTVYGITDLAIHTSGLQAIVEDCATAGKSKDARDKFFQSFVGESDSCSSKALRSELPSLEVPSIVVSVQEEKMLRAS